MKLKHLQKFFFLQIVKKKGSVKKESGLPTSVCSEIKKTQQAEKCCSPHKKWTPYYL